MTEHDPPAFPGPEMPPLLGEALAAARAEVPDAAQQARLAARLPLEGAPPAPSTSSTSTTAPPSVLSGALIGAGLGVLVVAVALLWPASPGERPQSGLPGPATVPSEIASPSPEAVAPRAVVEAPADRRPLRGGLAESRTAHASSAAVPSAAAPTVAPEPGPAVVAGSDPVDRETEVHLLQRAQDALGGSPAQALALTQEHATRFPGGALGQEREVVAIQALLHLGRRGEARARYDRFVAAFPGSAHRRRLEALLGP